MKTALSFRQTNCIIHWIEIYPVDSVIQRLNYRGLELFFSSSSTEVLEGSYCTLEI